MRLLLLYLMTKNQKEKCCMENERMEIKERKNQFRVVVDSIRQD
jgi:hypothetical protein